MILTEPSPLVTLVGACVRYRSDLGSFWGSVRRASALPPMESRGWLYERRRSPRLELASLDPLKFFYHSTSDPWRFLRQKRPATKVAGRSSFAFRFRRTVLLGHGKRKQNRATMPFGTRLLQQFRQFFHRRPPHQKKCPRPRDMRAAY